MVDQNLAFLVFEVKITSMQIWADLVMIDVGRVFTWEGMTQVYFNKYWPALKRYTKFYNIEIESHWKCSKNKNILMLKKQQKYITHNFRNKKKAHAKHPRRLADTSHEHAAIITEHMLAGNHSSR